MTKMRRLREKETNVSKKGVSEAEQGKTKTPYKPKEGEESLPTGKI